jgi:toxin-antitoxin system PIN domain toxin
MALLDVNAPVALAWDSHVHHATMRSWFGANARGDWATCSVVEAGFVRVSSNPKALPASIPVEAARGVLAALRDAGGHRFLADDVSICDPDVPRIVGHRPTRCC